MKRLFFYVFLLLVLFALCLWNTAYVTGVTDHISAQLEQAEEAVIREDWDAAVRIINAAAMEWEDHQAHFAIAMRYMDTDEVSTGFQEIEGFLRWQEGAEFTSANSALIEKVRHLAQVEGLTWANLF